MRHRVAYRKLGRVTDHRIALLRNQATALLRYEHLTTTVPRAKELRPFVERIITIAKRGIADGAANGKALHARRLVMHDVQDREIGSEFDPKAKVETEAKGEAEPPKAKGVGGRLRAAAERLRGKKGNKGDEPVV